MKKSLLCLFATFILISQNSNAKTAQGSMFFVEPLLGYKTHTFTGKMSSTTSDELKMNGIAAGIRLGFKLNPIFSIDAEYNYHFGKYDRTLKVPTTLSDSADFKNTMASLQLGIAPTPFFKLHLGYIFLDEASFDSTSKNIISTSFRIKGSSGYQLGITGYLMNNLGIGIMYNVHSYKDTVASGTTTSINTSYPTSTSDSDLGLVLSYMF